MAVTGKDLMRAKQLLEAGELVAIPTETVYGLAGNALNPEAAARIFEVKNRPHFDPLIVHVASLEASRSLVRTIPPAAKQLVDHFWPGPLTILLDKTNIIPDLVTSGLDRVGLRCPDHGLTQSLLELIDFPLAAPSANPFGYVSPTTAAHVEEQLGSRIPYILDGGPCHVGVESTIIGWEDGLPVMYRIGGVTVEQIEMLIGKVKVLTHSSSQPSAPGQLTSHYAPAKIFYLGEINSLLKKHAAKKVGILTFTPGPVRAANVIHQLSLTEAGDLHEAARNLFSMLRQFDKMDVDLVLAEEVPNEGLGRAINDRLRRAAAMV